MQIYKKIYNGSCRSIEYTNSAVIGGLGGVCDVQIVYSSALRCNDNTH